MQTPEAQRDEFSALLEGNRENGLTAVERKRVDELHDSYGQSMIRKSEAIKVAVLRVPVG